MRCGTFLFTILLGLSSGLDNSLGRKPAMGYNSWYDLMGDLNEENLKATAQAMVDLGLVKLGYEYFNLDDIWAKGRNVDGTIYADPSKFPSKSLKPLADFVHNLGMKFGTYTDRGVKTCGGRPGSLNHEALDAKIYAEWGVDYVKEDSCNAPKDHEVAFKQYAAMRDGLNATGRPIYFSLCGWETWYAPVGQLLGNSWRIGPDDTNWAGVLKNIDINAEISGYSGPGGWNDPCLLLAEDEHVKQRITELQSRAQFSMWAVMASPLLISADVRNMSATNVETYKNTEVIAVNQDPWGRQGIRLAGSPLSSSAYPLGGLFNVWGRSLSDGSWALVFLNVGKTVANVTCDIDCLSQTGIVGQVTVRDLWAHKDLGKVSIKNPLVVNNLPANGGSAMYKLSTVL